MRPLPLLLAALLCAACDRPAPEGLPGYAEGETVRLAAPLAGTLVRVAVQRGDRAVAGAPAFVLESESEAAAAREAASRVARAQAQLADLKKGARSDELARIEAALREAEAALALSRADHARDRQLVAERFVSRARLEQTAAAVGRDSARVAQARAALRTARAGARPDLVEAASREVEAAQAQLAQVRWRLEQKAVTLPAAGTVTDVAYRPGEWVAAGAPVLTLLPPDRIRARFFVPQARLGALRVGQRAAIACDGCPARVAARITYLSPEAEYTAPLIYSKENRAELVFMAEATPDPGQPLLHPGQPLTVLPEGWK